MRAKRGSEVAVGDIIEFLGAPHRITRIEPYSHPIVTEGEQWAIAYADTPRRNGPKAWGITVWPRGWYEVL